MLKREIFALPLTYQSSNQADDYNFVYKIPCEEIRRQMVLNGLSAKVTLTKQHTATLSFQGNKLFIQKCNLLDQTFHSDHLPLRYLLLCSIVVFDYH